MKLKLIKCQCFMIQYEEKSGALNSDRTYLKRYFNDTKNEDILLIWADKSRISKKRQNNPFFIINLDNSIEYIKI